MPEIAALLASAGVSLPADILARARALFAGDALEAIESAILEDYFNSRCAVAILTAEGERIEPANDPVPTGIPQQRETFESVGEISARVVRELRPIKSNGASVRGVGGNHRKAGRPRVDTGLVARAESYAMTPQELQAAIIALGTSKTEFCSALEIAQTYLRDMLSGATPIKRHVAIAVRTLQDSSAH